LYVIDFFVMWCNVFVIQEVALDLRLRLIALNILSFA